MKNTVLLIAAATMMSSPVLAQTTESKAPATAAPVEQTAPAAAKPVEKLAKPAPANVDSAKAPLEGANSFTEAQAKQRIVDAGYTGISTLAKDERGVWRGTAMKEGKSAGVAVDFKGNVVQAN